MTAADETTDLGINLKLCNPIPFVAATFNNWMRGLKISEIAKLIRLTSHRATCLVHRTQIHKQCRTNLYVCYGQHHFSAQQFVYQNLFWKIEEHFQSKFPHMNERSNERL
jgi:hypothetical protein